MLDPIEHRRRQIENMNKAFSDNNEFEKAWKIGDEKQYQGTTWVVGGFNAKGTPLWRKKKDGGSGTAPAKTPASNNSSANVGDLVNVSGRVKPMKIVKIKRDSTVDSQGNIVRCLHALTEEGNVISNSDNGKGIWYNTRWTEDPNYEYKHKGKKYKNPFVGDDYAQTYKNPSYKGDDKKDSGSSKVFIDETSIDSNEYDRMHAQAQSVDKNSRSLGLKIIEGNIKQVKSELEDTIKNRPGAKAKIADLQKKLTMFVSQKKATEDVINGAKSSSALTSIDEVKEGSKYKINGETYYVAVMKELKGLPFKAIPFVGLVKESDGSLAAKSGDEIEREIKNGDWEHVTDGKTPSAKQDASKQDNAKKDSGTPNIIKLKDFNNVSADRLKRIQGFLQSRNPDNPNEQRIFEDDGMDDDRLADLQAVAERNMSNRGLNDKTREYCRKWNDLALAEIHRRNKERKDNSK